MLVLVGVELDAAMLEREAEDAKRYLRDANCQRIWLDVSSTTTIHTGCGYCWWRASKPGVDGWYASAWWP